SYCSPENVTILRASSRNSRNRIFFAGNANVFQRIPLNGTEKLSSRRSTKGSLVNFLQITSHKMDFQKVMRNLLTLLFVFTSVVAFAQETQVMVMEIKETIDPRMKRYVDLALQHADETEADILIIEMDTYGGT